jgi:hypothetical protein
MKYKYLNYIILFILINFSCKINNESQWKDLIIDNSMEGWHIFQDDGKKSGWQVKNNVLTFIGVSDMETGKGDASLLSDKIYYNFEIKFDSKVIEGANSGFMWGVNEDKKYRYPYQTGPEIQILDPYVYENYKSVLGGEIEENNILTDIKERKHFIGSLYDLSAPSKDMFVYPSNKWNSYHIIINYEKNLGKVILNNRLINSFPLIGQKWDSMIRKSKFSKSEDYPYLGDSRWYDFGKFHKGKICFQDHPGEVSFKNVKIKEIK